MVIREGVHRRLRDDEAIFGCIHSQDVNPLLFVGDSIASATLCGVPMRHGINPADIWEVGERVQGSELGVFGLETVGPVRTCYFIEGEGSVVIVVVVSQRRDCLYADAETGDEGEDSNEDGGMAVHRQAGPFSWVKKGRAVVEQEHDPLL